MNIVDEKVNGIAGALDLHGFVESSGALEGKAGMHTGAEERRFLHQAREDLGTACGRGRLRKRGVSEKMDAQGKRLGIVGDHGFYVGWKSRPKVSLLVTVST